MGWYYKSKARLGSTLFEILLKMLKFALLVCLGLTATAQYAVFDRRSPDPDQVAKLLQLMSSLKVSAGFIYIYLLQTQQTRDPMLMQRRGWMPMFRRSANFDDYYDQPMIQMRAPDGELHGKLR